ncbi:hypothetical protein CRUP_035333 [Coryphaenoides rupestris]|nr:hypothetical protein CRUP_035333 [Coryphaenoides rupestris]
MTNTRRDALQSPASSHRNSRSGVTATEPSGIKQPVAMRRYSSTLTHYPRPGSTTGTTSITLAHSNRQGTSPEHQGTDGDTGEPTGTADMPAFSFYEATPVHPVRFTSTAEVIVRRCSGGGERSVPIHVIATETRRKSRSPGSGSPDRESSHLTGSDADLMLASLIERLSNGTELSPVESDGLFGLGLFGSSNGTDRLSTGTIGTDRLGTGTIGTDRLGTGTIGTDGLGTGTGGAEQDREAAPDPSELLDVATPPWTWFPVWVSSLEPAEQNREEEEEEEEEEEPVLLGGRGVLQSPVPREEDGPLPLALREQVSLHLAEVERQDTYLRKMNKFRFRVVPDGNCLYRAVCRATRGHQAGHRELRQRTVHHIADHLEQFGHVIEGDVGEFLIGAAQDGAWAGYPELLAMSQMLQVRIHLTTGGGEGSPTGDGGEREDGCAPPPPDEIWLSWLSNGHYDVVLDRSDVPNPEHEAWSAQALAQRRRDEELARSMAASLSRMYLEQNGK